MENFNCTPQQVEEVREKIFKTLRDWSESEYQEEMTFLGIDDSNMSWERKKILVILYMLSGVKDKEGWFYIDNINLSEICEVGERTITRVKRDFERLGIIKIKRGYQGYPTRYKFFENKLNKLPKISKKTSESTLAALAGKNVIPANENEIRKSLITSLLSSYIEVPANEANKKDLEKNILEGGVQYKEQYKDKNKDIEKDKNKNKDIEKDEYKEGLIMNKINNNKTMEELIKKLIVSIDNNTRVQLEVNTKLIESNDRNNKELTTSILSLKNGNETNLSIETYKKEIEEKDNRVKTLQDEINKIQDEASTLVEKKDIEIEKLKEENNKLKEENNKLQERLNKVTATANGNKTNHSSYTSNVDKIISYQLKSVTEHPTKDKAWKQETTKQEQSPKVDTKTTVVENNSNNDEKNYVLKKLECEIIKPFKSSIINAKNYEKLMKTQEDFADVVKKFYTVHNDVITSSEMKSIINEVRTVFQQKEEELTSKVDTNESSSKSNGIVQVEEDNTNSLQQNTSNEETKETTAVENSSKEDEAKYNQFQSNKETTPKTENCEEKKEATAEPSTSNSKNIEVSKTDTPNDKEKTQEELDKELDKTVSSMFLTDTKQAVSTKKSEEVKFPETKVIPLREGEEKRQFQELVDNTTINQMLESYSALDGDKYKEILTEIRKAVTKGNYQKKIVNAYIEHIWNTYSFDCNLQDAMKPLEDTKEVTVTATSTPKMDSLEEFIKDKVDNIEKNVKECGDELPFGNNSKSNHQDVDESNYYQSEEEKVAMAATCSYDESQDALF